MSRRAERMLKTYATPKRARKPIISVDIETEAIGRGSASAEDFKIGAYSREGSDEVVHFHDTDEWLRAIVEVRANRDHVWYAHNGGEFDYKFLLPAIERYQASHPRFTNEIVTQGNAGRVIGFVFRVGHKKFELRDSFALVATKLSKFAGQFSTSYQKDTFDWEHDSFDVHNPAHIQYLHNDVLALKAALIGFFEIIESNFHVPVAWTISATALRAWRHTIPEGWGFWRQRPEVEAFCRKAYYGGLVFLTTVAEQHDAAAIDVNSMYPFVMRKFGVPTGTGCYTTKRNKRFPGFYRVRVQCPEDVAFTCLAYRDDHNTLSWPTGTFETYASSVDIDRALSLGYQIAVIEGFEFERSEFLFTEFIDRCEQLRIAHKGTAVEAAVKVLQNGLYGKFGTNPVMTKYQQSTDMPKDYTPVINSVTGEIVDDLYTKAEMLEASYIQPHWAAWITSQARNHLIGLCAQIGFEHVYYGDTDSVTADRAAIERAAIPQGVQYGQVKTEHSYDVFIPRGPKCYFGREVGGNKISKAKGIPHRVVLPEHMEERMLAQEDHLWTDAAGIHAPREGYYTGDGKFYFSSMNSTMAIIKGGKPFYENRHRTLSTLAHSTGWRVVGAHGNVRPVHKLDGRTLEALG